LVCIWETGISDTGYNKVASLFRALGVVLAWDVTASMA